GEQQLVGEVHALVRPQEPARCRVDGLNDRRVLVIRHPWRLLIGGGRDPRGGAPGGRGRARGGGAGGGAGRRAGGGAGAGAGGGGGGGGVGGVGFINGFIAPAREMWVSGAARGAPSRGGRGGRPGCGGPGRPPLPGGWPPGLPSRPFRGRRSRAPLRHYPTPS